MGKADSVHLKGLIISAVFIAHCPKITISGQKNYETTDHLLAVACIGVCGYQHTQIHSRYYTTSERGLPLEATGNQKRICEVTGRG
jgi:hypothetical protein